MRSIGCKKHPVQRISSIRRGLLVVVIVLMGILVRISFADPLSQATQLEQTTEAAENARLVRLNYSNASIAEFVTTTNTQDEQRHRGSRLSSMNAKRDSNSQHNNKQTGGNQSEQAKKISNGRKHDEALSTDCFAKRNEVLSRQSHTASAAQTRATTSTPLAGYQRLKPRLETNPSTTSTLTTSVVLNETLANNFDGEHIPRCKNDGSYEPVQCHKIGYCWCVNKFGQAIKNSAVMSGEEPFCDPNMYESDSDDLLVVAGISAQRMKNLLKSGGSPVEGTTPNGHINFEATEPSSEPYDSDDHQQVEAGKRLGSNEPTMPLIPNDCKSSRTNARERALKHVNDSIWVPECDMDDEKLYSERQCHKSKVCWCVDQSTGLPLRSGEQLSTRSASSNCTEVKKILELTSMVAKPMTVSVPQQPAFYHGSSEFCDADKRIDFVIALSNQFRQQISEYMRQNPTGLVPTDLSSNNPYAISESQVSKWKFDIMDRDLDGKLGDREWSKFKNNFKLVDKPDELDNPFKQQKSPYFSLAPLLIVRSQRKCWRDFLEFCGSGDLLVDESISLTKWLSCTEVPPRSSREDGQYKRVGQTTSMENTRAHSREAAIVRSKKKNPFLGILKPD